MTAPAYYTPGTLVAVHVPKGEINYPMVKEFDGNCYKVKHWQRYSASYMYTLEGCRSKYGVPFWFAHEWLRRVGD